jgi:hypothetical protein
MNREMLGDIAKAAGVLESAVVDVQHRAEAHFGDLDHPTEDEVRQWIDGKLRDQAPHFWAPLTGTASDVATRLGVPEEIWSKLSSAERLNRLRAQEPPPTKRRPVVYTPTAQQQAELDKLPLLERLSAYRRMRDEQA